MEKSGPKPVVSHDMTIAAVAAALGKRGVMLQPRGVALVEI
jgi:hypothetical protein